jgi:hypothetical protein
MRRMGLQVGPPVRRTFLSLGTPMIAARNVGLWFLSVLLSVGLFSLAFAGLYGWSPDALARDFLITMKFALPVACLFLPIVITQRDAEEWRTLVIAGSGIVIGPAFIVLLALIAALRGKPDVIAGDPLGFGLKACLVFAFIVGSLTTILYITTLKLVHHLTSASKQASYSSVTGWPRTSAMQLATGRCRSRADGHELRSWP